MDKGEREKRGRKEDVWESHLSTWPERFTKFRSCLVGETRVQGNSQGNLHVVY